VARAGLIAAREAGAELEADDLDSLGDCAWWLGLGDESVAAYEQAYRLHVQHDEPRKAAMSACGAAVTLFLRGDATVGSGWMSRAQRLLADEPECAEHGYLLYGEVEGALDLPDLEPAFEGARRLQDMGRRHQDPVLVAVGVLMEGRAKVRGGQIPQGMQLLDDAMLAALSDELPPAFTGNIYCHLVAACWELGDLRRARDWTAALERWLATLPAAVVFGGICRVHRAQLMQVQGDWATAEQEAARACADLAGISLAPVAEGWYAVGDLQRLRGDLSAAAEAYECAHRLGRDPQPGRALLQLARGRVDGAAASIRAALAAESRGPLHRVRLWAAQVEIALAQPDLDCAQAASAELEAAATTYAGAGLVAMAEQARGAVLMAQGDVAAALPVLRVACGLWIELAAPYDVARTRLLLAGAYQGLGDLDAAAMELDAAEETFVELGAAPDAAAVARQRSRAALPDGLTPRQTQVLALVAEGRSNRQVAAALVLSEKTIERHLSNIFAKLNLTSRTAATAYAFEHGLVRRAMGGVPQP
jgi:DNA-binding CsgD family transcriptional regulator